MKAPGLLAALALGACASMPNGEVARIPDYRARLERYLACVSLLNTLPPENLSCARALQAERPWTGRELSDGVAPKLGLPSENVLGMRTTETSTLGVQLDPPVTYRMGKVTAIRTRVAPGGRRPVLALGDSLGDREMLEDSVDLAVLIDRGDTDLAAVLRSRGVVLQRAFEGATEQNVAEKPRPPARPRRR